MENQELVKFVSDSRAHGLSDAQIKSQLISAGWPENDVNQALAGNNTTAAVPMPQSQGPASSDLGMWAAFEYVLMFIALAFSATGIAGLLHHFVDSKISLPTTSATYYSLSYYSDYLVPFYIACLIVGFPIFGFLALRLRLLINQRPEVRNAKIRKAAIYIALIWTFLAMLIRLVETVYDFVKGNAFVANVLSHLVVTLVVSGAIFIYFASEVRKDGQA